MPKAYGPGSRQVTNGIGVEGHPSEAGVKRPDGRRKAPLDPVGSRQLPVIAAVTRAQTRPKQASSLTVSRRLAARCPAPQTLHLPCSIRIRDAVPAPEPIPGARRAKPA